MEPFKDCWNATRILSVTICGRQGIVGSWAGLAVSFGGLQPRMIWPSLRRSRLQESEGGLVCSLLCFTIAGTESSRSKHKLPKKTHAHPKFPVFLSVSAPWGYAYHFVGRSRFLKNKIKSTEESGGRLALPSVCADTLHPSLFHCPHPIHLHGKRKGEVCLCMDKLRSQEMGYWCGEWATGHCSCLRSS